MEEARESSANGMELFVPESTISALEELLCSTHENSSNQSLRNALSAASSIVKQL